MPGGLYRRGQAVQDAFVETEGFEEFAVPGAPGFTGGTGCAQAGFGPAVEVAERAAVGFAAAGVQLIPMLAGQQFVEVVGGEKGPVVDEALAGGVGGGHGAEQRD